MARKRGKVVETAVVVLPEEVIVADVVNEEEPVEVVGAVEENGLLESDTVVEENKQEEIPVDTVETVENDSFGFENVDMNTAEEGTKQEEVPVDTAEEEIKQDDISAETAVDNSAEPVDEEVNMEDVSSDTEEEMQDSNESLPESIEDKEVIPAVSPIVFRSNSEEARYYILQCLEDGEAHKKKEIVDYITERSGKVFTEATVINVLRGMTNSGSILSLERGSYKVGTGSSLTSKMIQFIEITRSNLEKVATISVCDMQEEDYKAISELKQLKDTLNNMYERLAGN